MAELTCIFFLFVETQGVITMLGLFGGAPQEVTSHFLVGSILVGVASLLYKVKTQLPLPSLGLSSLPLAKVIYIYSFKE